jgi:phosphatidate cytidylyltransferase
MSALLQRVVWGVVLVVLLLGILLLLPPLAGVLLVCAFLAIGGWEWAAFFGWTSRGRRTVYAALVSMLVLLGFQLVPAPAALAPLLWLSLFWWAACLVAILRFPRSISRPMAALAGLLVLVPGGVTVTVLLAKLPAGAGVPLVLLVLVIVWAADVGAYFTGRRLGRHKLAPGVSPGKTWEGVGGGLLASGLAAVAGGAVLDMTLPPPVALFVLGAGLAAISVVGDLTVSMYKRNVGLKDSGHLIPGHGGALDRVDSITAAVPLYVLVLLLSGVIGA